MEIIKTKEALGKVLLRPFTHKGFVPTMGALHEGHISLFEKAKAENDLTIASIFVNPTQFTNPKDLEFYPRPIETDLKILEGHGVDIAFIPNTAEIYTDAPPWHLDLSGMDLILEGKSRPGHFQGVTQIVKILFDLVRPQKAYFGQKDYQQVLVVKKLVDHFRLPIEIISCPIVREADGLAMSSRNIRLSQAERAIAPKIYATLKSIELGSKNLEPDILISKAINELNAEPLIQVDYLEIVGKNDLQKRISWIPDDPCIALIAVKLGETRLIDNIIIKKD